MTWNYRLFRETFDDGETVETTYTIRECQYAKPGDVIPVSWGPPTAPVSDAREGLLWVIAGMLTAIGKEALEVRDGKAVEVEPVDIRAFLPAEHVLDAWANWRT